VTESAGPAAPRTELPAEPRAAVTMLFHTHQRKLVGLATLLLNDREAAEDVVQEAFCHLYRKWSDLRDPQAALGYLHTTTINLSRSKLRRIERERRLTVAPPPNAEPADAASLARETTTAVIDALALLPRRQREVVVLRYYEDLSELEISRTLWISPGAVKQHASRALAKLSRRLEELT
jgi:RNA polymerase sigma-70 factor (sigma-E family)